MGAITDTALFHRFWNITPKEIFHLLFKKNKYVCGSKSDELYRLRIFPRYTETYTSILGRKLKLVDSASFIFLYDEIFLKEIYKFKTNSLQPYIIDCGANIGLSSIYFKKLYPNAKIVAFEPDSKIFKVLKYNLESFGCSDVKIFERGIWSEETTLEFFSEGADGGRIAVPGNADNLVEIKTIRLRPFLEEPVDFLKIDIEGAETNVLNDCRDLLSNVQNLFVEYHSFISEKQSLSKILGILSEAGFRTYITSPGFTSRKPFIQRNVSANMDMQLNIYAYREKDK